MNLNPREISKGGGKVKTARKVIVCDTCDAVVKVSTTCWQCGRDICHSCRIERQTSANHESTGHGSHGDEGGWSRTFRFFCPQCSSHLGEDMVETEYKNLKIAKWDEDYLKTLKRVKPKRG